MTRRAPVVVVSLGGPRLRVAGIDLTVRALRVAASRGAPVVLFTDREPPPGVAGVVRGGPGDLVPWLRARGGPCVVGTDEVVLDRYPAALEEGAGWIAHDGRAAGWCHLDHVIPSDLVERLHDPGTPARDVVGWHVRVRDEGSRREAEERIFAACRKAVDGVVSRHLNRPVSLWLSRRLVALPWSPDSYTAITFAVAVLGALMATGGTYAATLGGAILMHVASVLDGVDGEIARARVETSARGAWLDTIGDDLSNVLFWLALGVGAARVGEPVLGVAGGIAGLANLGAAAVSWWLLAQRGTGDWYALADLDRPAPGRLRRVLEVLLKQDFFLLLCVVLAACGWLHPALPVFALAALLAFGNAVSRALAHLRGGGLSRT